MRRKVYVFSFFPDHPPCSPTVCANNSDVAQLRTAAFAKRSVAESRKQEEDAILNGCPLHLPRGILFLSSYPYKINKGLCMGRQRLGGADNQLRMCRVLSHLSSLQKHLSIHTQLTPTRFSTSTFFFFLLFFPPFFMFFSVFLVARQRRTKEAAREGL